MSRPASVLTIAGVLTIAVVLSLSAATFGQERDTSRGDRMIATYFANRTQELADRCMAEVESLKDWEQKQDVPLWLQAVGEMSGIALYAALFEPGEVARLDLYDLPASHQNGPTFLNVLRVTDLPQTVPYVANSSKVVIYDNEADRWSYSRHVADRDERVKAQLQIRKRP